MAGVNITASTPASRSTRLASGSNGTSMVKSAPAIKSTTTVNKGSSTSVGKSGVKISSSSGTPGSVRMSNSVSKPSMTAAARTMASDTRNVNSAQYGSVGSATGRGR